MDYRDDIITVDAENITIAHHVVTGRQQTIPLRSIRHASSFPWDRRRLAQEGPHR